MTGSASDYRDRLIAARGTLGLSRKAMAQRLLTPWQTYQQWETGARRTPGIAVIAAEDAVKLRRYKSTGIIDWERELERAVERGETMPEVAARLGSKRGTVWLAAKRAGITLRHDRSGRRNINWNVELRIALDRGETGAECARRLGVNRSTPVRAAARLGVKFRPSDPRKAHPVFRRSRNGEPPKQKPSKPRDILRDGAWELA